MGQITRTDAFCNALDEDDGSVQLHDNNGYVTLGVDTYLFTLTIGEEQLVSFHIQTDATIAGTFTVETSNMPRDSGESGTVPGSVTDWDTTAAGSWVKEDPTTAYVATIGTGWTVTNLTMAKTAGAGSAICHLGNIGSRRVRIKAVITTAGTMRVAVHGKSG